jgi:hypothetical protein
MNMSLRIGGKDVNILSILPICAIGLLWCVVIVLTPPRFSRYVIMFPIFLGFLWARSVRTLLISLGRQHSGPFIFALMSTIYFVCLLVRYKTPYSGLLVPLVFVLLHAVVIFFKKESGPAILS